MTFVQQAIGKRRDRRRLAKKIQRNPSKIPSTTNEKHLKTELKPVEDL